MASPLTAPPLPDESMCTGGGCFIFDDHLRTIIVHSVKNGSHGVPKGRREKKIKESFQSCVEREVEEETGIKFANIHTIPNVLLTERINTNILVGYRVGFVKEMPAEFIFDKNELESVTWCTNEQVANVLRGRRLSLYREAYTIAKNYQQQQQKLVASGASRSSLKSALSTSSQSKIQ